MSEWCVGDVRQYGTAGWEVSGPERNRRGARPFKNGSAATAAVQQVVGGADGDDAGREHGRRCQE